MKPLLVGSLVALLAITATAATTKSRVYVSVENGPISVSKISPDTGKGLAAFTVPFGSQNMALTPNGRQAYVLAPSNAFNVGSVASAVSVYDLPSNTLVRTIPLTSAPWQVYFSPDGTIAYVVASDGGPPVNETFTLHLFAIDTATGAVTTDEPYPALAGPEEVQQDAISPDGKLLYVASATAGNPEVAIFSLPSLSLAGSFAVGTPGSGSSSITGMAVTPNGEYLVIGASPDIGLAIYSTASNAIVGQAALGEAYVVAVSSDSRSAYTLGAATAFGSITLQKVDLSTFQLTDSGVEVEIGNLIVPPDGGPLLAGSIFLDPVTLSVTVPNVNTLSITAYGAFTPSSRTLWVLNSKSTELVVIDPATNEVTDTIAIPDSLGIAPGEGKSLLLGGARLAIASTDLDQVVRSSPPNGEGSEAVVQAGGNAYINSGKEIVAYNLQTLSSSQLALPPVLDGYVDIVNAIAASPNGTRFYADYYTLGGIGPDATHVQSGDAAKSCEDSGFIAYDTSTNDSIWCVPLDPDGAIAISPDSSTAYVGGLFAIATVDLNLHAIRAVTRFRSDGHFAVFAVSPDGTTLYGLDEGTQTVAVIDVATMTVTQRYSIPQGSNGMVITPDGAALYLPNSVDPLVTVIDTATGQTTAIPLPSTSDGDIAVAPI